MNDIPEKLKSARSQLEELRNKRAQAQDAVRQFDLNEAAWLGFIEALSPYENLETGTLPEIPEVSAGIEGLPELPEV
jgi:hypothetical protein